jgi:3-dehydroquinate synthetase
MARVLSPRSDALRTRGALTFILAHRIGDCCVAKNVDADEISAFLREEAGLPDR